MAVNPGKKASTMEIWDGKVWIGKEPATLNEFIVEYVARYVGCFLNGCYYVRWFEQLIYYKGPCFQIVNKGLGSGCVDW